MSEAQISNSPQDEIGPSLVERYGAGERDFSRLNLWCVDLHEADLHGADLGGADLRYADLHGANLHDVNLVDADLWGAELQGADLRGIKLSGLELWGSYFDDATRFDQGVDPRKFGMQECRT